MGLLVTLGIVFGDIGTSPLYVMKAVHAACPEAGADYFIGAVSCVIWTLTLQTTVKYVVIALRADNRGEGGILALYSLLRRIRPRWLYAVAAAGAATLIADGVITPAITVTSAVEGLRTVMPSISVTPIVILIIVVIFWLQKSGTGRIGKFFGPFMLLWFLFLGVTGGMNIHLAPEILKAFNPLYAVRLLVGFPEWWLILGAVFLCTTGAEALYSDLGHCGRLNISVSWFFVKVMLVVNYLGQGAWLISRIGEPVTQNPFYGVMPHGWIVPAVILSTGAAVIASQALISGSFTIFSEAMGLDFWPRLGIKYPSDEKGQLYIPAVNWALLAGCLLTVLIFRDSSRMEAAYGLAITVTMLMTTVLLTFFLRHKGVPVWICVMFLGLFAVVECGFLVANCFKFMHGGWFTILIAFIVVWIMVNWRASCRLRKSFVELRRLDDYCGVISDIKADREIPRHSCNIVYFSTCEDPEMVESKIIYSIVNKKPKRADHYWIIRIVNDDAPYTLRYSVRTPLPGTVYDVTLHLGFRVSTGVNRYLRQIVEDLVASGELELESAYPSLGKRGIAGDFSFIVIRRVFSSSSNCSGSEARLMRRHELIRRLGVDTETALGIDTGNVTVEPVPLIIDSRRGRRVERALPSDGPID